MYQLPGEKTPNMRFYSLCIIVIAKRKHAKTSKETNTLQNSKTICILKWNCQTAKRGVI